MAISVPGTTRRDGQLFFVLTMLLKERAMDKVELVDKNCGVQLWRKLTEVEEQTLEAASGKTHRRRHGRV